LVWRRDGCIWVRRRGLSCRGGIWRSARLGRRHRATVLHLRACSLSSWAGGVPVRRWWHAWRSIVRRRSSGN
jgi:hypothetical protein